MNVLVWLLVLAIGAGLVGLLWITSRRAAERKQAEEQRAAAFLAEAMSAAPKPAAQAPRSQAPQPAVAAQEWLLVEAAAKAAEAGEPALSIQLYARLLSRFPGSALAAQARAAIEAQKKKLSTVTTPGPAAPG